MPFKPSTIFHFLGFTSKTHHCQVDLATGKIIAEFTSDAELFDDPILNHTWHIAYGYVEARAKSKTQASNDALTMRRKHLLDSSALQSDTAESH